MKRLLRKLRQGDFFEFARDIYYVNSIDGSRMYCINTRNGEQIRLERDSNDERRVELVSRRLWNEVEAVPAPEPARDPASIYVLAHDYALKIGIARDTEIRRQAIESMCGLPVSLLFAAELETRERAGVAEAWAHHVLAEHHTVGEWFSCGRGLAIRATKWAAVSAPSKRPFALPELADRLPSFIAAESGVS